MTTTGPRIAVIGAGPAGIYAAHALVTQHEDATVDIFEALPAPFGLVRYGVAPDHPRIKEVAKALGRALLHDRMRLFANVSFGSDITLDDIQSLYDAVIFATGASKDRELGIPGIDLPGSYGAADFVSWFDGHPDVPRDWPLDAESVAVIGAGNVALDVARMLAKPVEEQMSTEIPANVVAGLAANKARTVHIVARRGPADVKFSAMELREISHSPEVDVFVHEHDFLIDEAHQKALAKKKSQRTIVDILMKYLDTKPSGASRQIHIHLCSAPVSLVGNNAVSGLMVEKTEPDGTGAYRRTGVVETIPVQAVYRAIGYRSLPVEGVPFDSDNAVIPNHEGRVLSDDGSPIPGVYTTGWVKRGPVGLIGHTKSDAAETVGHLLADLAMKGTTVSASPDDVVALLHRRGINFVTADGWLQLDMVERQLGESQGRERIKIVSRDDMLAATDSTRKAS